MVVTFPKSSFQILLRSDIVELHPSMSASNLPQKILQMGMQLSKPGWSPVPLLTLARGDRIHTSNLDAAFKAMSPRPLATQPKKPRGPFRHNEDILIAVILQGTLNPQRCLTSKTQKCPQQHGKNKYLHLSLPLQISAGTTECRILPPSPSLFFFFFT